METHLSISPVLSVSTILTCAQLQKIERGVQRGSLRSCRQDAGNRLSECVGDGRGASPALRPEKWTSNGLSKGVK